jgi:hypothetical protein
LFASQNKQPKVLCHQGKDLKGKPLLSALAAREEDVRNGKLTVRNLLIVIYFRTDPVSRLKSVLCVVSVFVFVVVVVSLLLLYSTCETDGIISVAKVSCLHNPQSIIFIRDRNAKGQEISGYIDYAHRLKIEDCNPYFEGKKKFLPKNTDLSFYNWDTASTMSTSTPNFQVTNQIIPFCMGFSLR